ncbi:MAG: hypothetical protein CMI90_00075 [Pelagibacteraceae bacterium]|nr:hypothetical protein [Pelagibacteraceae bacterium]|tara:strand:+ start:1051 stop:2622 length:1572 start_codon:yes stop_codon:yes gene_type:complete
MKMNVIYIKSPDSAWIDIANILKKKNSWNTVGWIGQKKYKINFDKFSKDNKANYFDQELFFSNEIDYYLNQQIHTKVNVDEILKKMKFHIPIIYEQINRWFDYAISENKNLKKLFLSKMIADISKFIEIYKIDIVVCPTVPHRIYDYVFYALQLIKNKPFLMVENTSGIRIKNNNLVNLNFGIYNVYFRTSYINNIKLNSNHKFDSEISKVLQYFKDKNDSIKYTYILANEKTTESLLYKSKLLIPKRIKLYLGFIIRNFFQGNDKTGLYLEKNSKTFCAKSSIKKNVTYKLLIHNNSQKAFNFYLNNSIKSDFPEKSVFFAGSRHPERSHCPDAGLLYDPLRILTKLSTNLPNDYFILYKEHPNNFNQPFEDPRKNIDFYKKLLELKNIIFIHPKIHSNHLIDVSSIVATATGTAGFEAAIRGKQSIIFGSCWYETLGSVKKLNNSFEIKNYFKNFRILDEKSIRKEISILLNKIYSCSFDLNYRRNNLVNFNDKSNPLYLKKLDLISEMYSNTYSTYKKFN